MIPAHPLQKPIQDRRLLLRMGAAILSSAGLYLILSIRYPLGPSLVDPRASWVSQLGPNLAWIAGQIAIYLVLTLLYITVIRQLITHVRRDKTKDIEMPWHILVIILGWLVFSIILMTVSPMGESHDIFDYAFRGRMMAEYNGNPLAVTPKLYERSPYYYYIAWHNNVDTYGPLWEISSAGVAAAVRQGAKVFGWWNTGFPSCPDSSASCQLLSFYLIGYRLLAVTLTGISAGLIAVIVGKTRPRLVPAALSIWLWNPLTLMATAVGGHNDLVMMVLFLASLWLMQRQRPYLALIVLILAAHVKLTALIWMPIYALWIIRKWGLRRALLLGTGSLFSGALISWLLYLPFGGWNTLPQMLTERSIFFGSSFWNVIYLFLFSQQGVWIPTAFYLVNNLPNWLFLAGAVLIPVWLFSFFPKRGHMSFEMVALVESKLWVAITLTAIFYLLVGAYWFQHWYLLWVLVPAALIPNSPFSRNILPWLCFGALAANFSGGFLLSLPSEDINRTFYNFLIVLIIWAPGLIAYLCLKPARRSLKLLFDDEMDIMFIQDETSTQ